MPKPVEISVILRTHNTNPAHLRRAVESVFNQDFQNFELIIVDDGSTYEYARGMVRYYTNGTGKLVYVHQPNRGESEAANRGVLNSTGKYITFLDSDDEYKPHHLTSCLEQIQQVDLLNSTATLVGDGEEDFYIPDRMDLAKLIHIDDTILFGTLFGKREVFNTIKFAPAYGADAIFFKQASMQYVVKKVNLRTYIYYRNIPNSLSTLIRNKRETV